MKNKGFSLIEMMVSLSVMTILTCAAMPSFIAQIEIKDKQKADKIVEVLNNAVHDLMVLNNCTNSTFSESFIFDKWGRVEYFVGGFDKCQITGYTFNPDALNQCELGLKAFKSIEREYIYIKELD